MVYRYHDGTKHHFHRFARSLGHLDWASQPAPFRSFAGAPVFPLYPSPSARGAAPAPGNAQQPYSAVAAGVDSLARGGLQTLSPARAPDYSPCAVDYDRLFAPASDAASDLSAAAIGDVLRHALGLSAWKQFRESRWSLRVNPSSGNLHPTEAYVVSGPLAGLAECAAVYHYAPDRHALEQRAAFEAHAWTAYCGDPSRVWLIALTSIHWREAWKYGERAFRYCQHDLGHAVAAIRLAAGVIGWRATMLPQWSQRDVAALTGIDRDDDYVDAEREEPGCLLLVTSRQSPVASQQSLVALHDARALFDAVRSGHWFGRPSQLSEDHVEWKFIDEIARATEDVGRDLPVRPVPPVLPAQAPRRHIPARAILLQRRSALAFDGRSSTDRSTFLGMLARVMPGPNAPWDALWWQPCIHLALFVHRVDGVAPGVYVLPRDSAVVERLKSACGREFLWESADERLPLLCLARGDCRRLAQRLSCDQEIAADGFFSLGMIADFDASLRRHGPSFYRHLFWESGVVGQVLYLEAEAAGARATGIGCFYDDPVHDALGISDHRFQSLYHFTVGTSIDDTRLTTEPGYRWEDA